MRIILSRKGFDSSNGGYPSPIMPDGTLLSLPIPSNDAAKYSDLVYNGENYDEILWQLTSGKSNTDLFSNCHVDPDIREDNRIEKIEGWKPAFGQVGSAQGTLKNAGVDVGDVFLFFGWFRQTEESKGCLRYRRSGDFYSYADLHVIYGYMEIGAIITDPGMISRFSWHPHAGSAFIENRTNALYLPADRLSLNPEKKGYGTFQYRQDRVLTMENHTRGTWNPIPSLMPENVYGHKKNSAKTEGLYYSGIWQELIINESKGLIDWVRQIIE